MTAYVVFMYVSDNTGQMFPGTCKYVFVREKPTFEDIEDATKSIKTALNVKSVAILNIIPISESED